MSSIKSEADIYIVGDIRYTEKVREVFTEDIHVEFCIAVQKLMEEMGVVKLDIAIDVNKYNIIKYTRLSNKVKN